MKEKCCFKNCESFVYCRKMCVAHYQQCKRNGEFKTSLYESRGGICSAEGCTKEVYAKGLCNKHWRRFHKRGDYSDDSLRNDSQLSIEERLLKNRIITIKGCWEWTKQKDKDGYGIISIKDKPYRVHRVSYKQFIGEIPKRMFILHKCDNPSCFNPEHLFVGSHDDNMTDMLSKVRQCKGESHPIHKLTEEDAKDIKERFKSFVSFEQRSYTSQCKEIAEIYNVSCKLIRNIYVNKAWKHV